MSRPSATRELFERARARVSPADVERYAPNDPGTLDYIAAFTAIVRGGEPALSREFAVTETIALTRWTHAGGEAQPRRFRWFRVLASTVELLIAGSDYPNYGLAALLVDGFALAEARDAAALELLPALFAEQRARLRDDGSKQLGFCLLGELLLAGPRGLDSAAIAALCAELEAHDRRYRRWWEFEDGHWTDEPKSDELLWSLTVFDQLHPVWVELVARRFPVAPAAALALRRRLLDDGARWARLPRLLS